MYIVVKALNESRVASDDHKRRFGFALCLNSYMVTRALQRVICLRIILFIVECNGCFINRMSNGNGFSVFGIG